MFKKISILICIIFVIQSVYSTTEIADLEYVENPFVDMRFILTDSEGNQNYGYYQLIFDSLFLPPKVNDLTQGVYNGIVAEKYIKDMESARRYSMSSFTTMGVTYGIHLLAAIGAISLFTYSANSDLDLALNRIIIYPIGIGLIITSFSCSIAGIVNMIIGINRYITYKQRKEEVINILNGHGISLFKNEDIRVNFDFVLH